MCDCHLEPEHDGNEDTPAGAAHGARVPAPPEGHELQREDEGAFRQVDSTSGVSGNYATGLLLTDGPPDHHMKINILTQMNKYAL